jgi:hypothetical protein
MEQHSRPAIGHNESHHEQHKGFRKADAGRRLSHLWRKAGTEMRTHHWRTEKHTHVDRRLVAADVKLRDRIMTGLGVETNHRAFRAKA